MSGSIKANCKAMRSEIEETILGSELSAKVTSHIRECNSCREFYQSDKKLRQVMAGLSPVEAPADFDFRLRARIAREQSQPRSLFPFGNVSLALPSAGLAALILLAGGALVFRNINSPVGTKTVASGKDQIAPITSPAPVPIPANDSGLTAKAVSTNPPVTSTAPKSTIVNKRQLISRERNKLVYDDSSSIGATTIRREDTAADRQAPLTFPVQTLKVSVDDGTGVSRTISIPTVSFGSQRTLVGAGASFQPPARGDW